MSAPSLPRVPATSDGTPITSARIASFHGGTRDSYARHWDTADHWGFFGEQPFPDDPGLFPAACRRAEQVLLAEAGLSPGGHVADIGCGGGAVALWLAAAARCRVTGIDLTPEMIAGAEKAKAAAGDSLCEFRVGNAAGLDLPDQALDGAWSQAAMYQFTDRAGALS